MSVTSPPITKLGRRPGLGQDQHQHRRGGGLAVCAGDCERLCHRADRREHARAVQRRYADAGCLVALDVALRDRGAPGDGITSVHQRAVVADADLHAGGAHSLQHRALANVAARDVMTHFGECDGDGAHAGATDADHV
jgi:hypothetical protein